MFRSESRPIIKRVFTHIFYGLLFTALVMAESALTTSRADDVVPAYNLHRINPGGFGVTYQGVLAWVPVSQKESVAFGRDGTISSETNGLVSFKLSDKGAVSSPRTIASGKEFIARAAATWFDGNGGESNAVSPHGFVFVLFILNNYIPGQGETAFVRMAKFDSQGKIIGDWKDLQKIKTPEDLYIVTASLHAVSKGNSIGVVLSLVYADYGPNPKNLLNSVAHFTEISAPEVTKIGKTVSLPLPRSGDHDYALASTLAWSGTRWLIPMTVGLEKNDDNDFEILGNKVLVISVTGDKTHSAAAHQISSDTLPYYLTYEDLWLTPYPDSSTDQLLFIKHWKRIPEYLRKLDAYSYSFSLNRIDGRGNLVKSKNVAIPALTHKIIYDPSYRISNTPFDYWSSLVTRDGILFVSRIHSIEVRNAVAMTHEFEQQFNFYAINALSGAVELKAQSFTDLYENYPTKPLINRFPDGCTAVINNLFQGKGLPNRSYFSRFDD
jgi:hypothetical protein